jgi:gliding motility-associated-like protein
MKKYTLLCFLCYPSLYFAQNLVPNPSFEQTATYWIDPQFFLAPLIDTSTTTFPNVLNWCSPTFGTPDYFNESHTAWMVRTPKNVLGYQKPRTGKAYIGLLNYEYNNFYFPNQTKIREAVQTRLVQNLEKDKLYCVKFYVSPTWIVGRFDSAVTINYYVVDGIGACLSQKRIFDYTVHPIHGNLNRPLPNCTTCVENPSGRILSDSAIWYEVKGLYKAQGGEQWLTISNFKDDAHTQKTQVYVQPGNTNDGGSYVYIDDVSVEKVSEPVFTSHDTAACTFPFILAARSSFDTYLWSTGETTASISVNQTGTYWVKVALECGTVTDTIRVLSPQTLTSHRDTSLCLPALLTANPATTYLWNTNETTQTISISNAGKYWVKRQINACSIAIDTFIVKGISTISTSRRDTTACLPTLLTAKTATTYLWNTAATTPSITAPQAGKYWVRREIAPCVYRTDTIQVREAQPPTPLHFADTLLCTTDFPIRYAIPQVFTNIKWSDNTTDNPKTIAQSGIYTVAADWQCGTVRDTFRVVSESPLPPIRLLTQDTTSCTKGRFVPFRLYAPHGYPNYMWNTGATTRNIIIQKDGNYSVNSHNICGNVTDAIKIEGCPPNYYIPNTFTPNGDGHNDIFTVFTTDAIVNIKKMQVFDRWGEQIVAIQNVLPSFGGAGGGWDGTFKGQEAASDVYVYLIVLEFADGTTETVSGDVTLLR